MIPVESICLGTARASVCKVLLQRFLLWLGHSRVGISVEFYVNKGDFPALCAGNIA